MTDQTDFVRDPQRAHDERRDFASAERLPGLVSVAAVIGGISVGAAWLLLHLIRVFTNLFFFQVLSDRNASPAANTLGLAVIAVPVIGGLVIGWMARYGSEKIRGHGIPEAIDAILFNKSRMSPKVAILKRISSGIAIGSGGPFSAEGPIIMTGGALGSLVGQFLHITSAERTVRTAVPARTKSCCRWRRGCERRGARRDPRGDAGAPSARGDEGVISTVRRMDPATTRRMSAFAAGGGPRLRLQLTASSSTSNTSVAFGGMTPPAPRGP